MGSRPGTVQLAGRYRVLSKLGEGACAEVFRVRDELLDRELALKRFKTAHLTPEALEILQQEFLLLTKLHHRGILQVHDVSVTGEEMFFTMEYLRGPDLLQGLRQGADGALPAARMQAATTALLAILSTLRYLHAQGVVHGDLKPSNVLYRFPVSDAGDPGDDVVLVDFGLHLPKLRGDGITGTLDYLAPEQLSSGALDAATDLFSLGVLFYEILAGEQPWEGKDALRRLQSRGAAVPKLADRVPHLPEGLGDVVHRLLALDRALRYRTAEEVQRDLLLVGGHDEDDAAVMLRRDFEFDPGLVGRETQIVLLRDHAAAAGKNGGGVLMALVADPGLGGRRLLRALRQQVQAAGGLAVTCNAGSGRVQGTVDSIIRRLEGNPDAATEEERGLRRDLTRVLDSFQPAGDRADDLSSRRQEVFERLARWAGAALRRRAHEGQEAVWIVEDVHRADAASRDCIRHLAGSVAQLPVLLLLVGERGDWLDEVEQESRLVLAGLDCEQTEALLRANFPDLQQPAEVAAVVHERVQGNLLLFDLLITEQVRTGALAYQARGWVADLEALRTCRLPASATDALQVRLDALAAGQQEVLSAAAVFGVRFVAHWVAATLRHSAADVVAVLESLLPLDLVVQEESPVTAPVYRLAHPALLQLLLQSLTETRLRALRCSAADHLRHELAAGQEPARAPLAHLCDELRQPAEAARLYAELGRRVRLQPEAAFTHLSRAVELLQRARQPATLELLQSLEEQALLVGRYKEALQAQRKILKRLADDDAARAAVLVRMGRVELMQGENRTARRRIQQALDLVPAATMGSAGLEANCILARVARGEGHYEEAARLYTEAVELAESRSGESLIRVLTSQGEFFLRRGDSDGAEKVFRRCLGMARTGKERFLLPGIHVGLGQLWMDRNPAEAVAPFEKAVELAREQAQVAVELGAHYNLGIVFTDLALLDRARDSYLHAQELVRSKKGLVGARIEAQLGNLARERGDFRQADAHYGQFVEKAKDLPETSPIRLLHRVNRALLALARGEAQAGLEELRRHESDYLDTYPRALMAYQRTRARLELEVGEREEAQRRARRVGELADRHQDPYFRIGAAMLEGELASNGSDPRAGQEKLLEARRLAKQMGNRKLQAEVSLLLAEVLLEHPELGEDPRAPLEEAREVLDRAGMRPALERVARLTRRLQGTPEWVAAHRPARTAKELSTLYRVSEIIRTHRSLEDLFSKLLDTAIQLMAAERGFIFLTRQGSRRLDARASRGGDRAVLRDAGQISRNILKATVQDAAPVFSTNAMTDERFRSNQSVLNYGIRSFICVPLLLPDRVLGTLYVDHRKLDSLFGQSDADFLMAYANFAASAIANALLQGELTHEVRHLRREVRQSRERDPMVGDSPAMQEVRDLIERIGPTESNVLVRGESGTGKELVARALHEHSKRAQGPLVAVNCAALPESLVESELFGVTRGAATDVTERPGKFEEAQGGTLFLDEIGDLSLAAQAKILRAIQSRRIQRLGSNRSVDLDIRLVAATHTDLEAAMEAGTFRDDLYYRLNVVEILLPPLRERREDVAAIVRHFVDRFCQEQGKFTLAIDSATLDTYLDHDWPGNVRELRNAVERAVLLAREKQLPPFVSASARERGATDLLEAFQKGHDEKQVKRTYARLVYQRSGGNKRRACRILGIDYKTLQSRLSSEV